MFDHLNVDYYNIKCESAKSIEGRLNHNLHFETCYMLDDCILVMFEVMS